MLVLYTSMDPSGNSTSYCRVSRIGLEWRRPVGIPSPSRVLLSTRAFTISPPRGNNSSFERYSSSSSGVTSWSSRLPCWSGGNSKPSSSPGCSISSSTGGETFIVSSPIRCCMESSNSFRRFRTVGSRNSSPVSPHMDLRVITVPLLVRIVKAISSVQLSAMPNHLPKSFRSLGKSTVGVQ